MALIALFVSFGFLILACSTELGKADIQEARVLSISSHGLSDNEVARSKRGCNGCGSGGGNGGGGCNGDNGGSNGCANNKGCSNGNCNNNRGSSGKSGSSSRSDAGGLSLRDLLILLPLLSQPRAPTLAAIPSSGADLAGGALLQLARVITRRQADLSYLPQHATPAAREQLRRLMLEEARRFASNLATPHPALGPNLAVPTTTLPTPTTTLPTPAPRPASEIADDYDIIPEPVIDPAKGKTSPGDPCEKDEECVPGAWCHRGAVAGLLKYCVCRPPLLGFDGRCVMPGSAGGPQGR